MMTFIRRFLTIIGTIFVIVIGVVALNWQNIMKPKPELKESVVPAATVFFQTARAEDVQMYVMSQGEVKPKTEIALTSRVSGKINSIAPEFADGGSFKKGQVLLRVESIDYQLNVTQAKAQVAQAQQALRFEEAESELARRDWEELGGLESGEAASALTLRQPQMEQARANYQSALASLRNAELNLSRTVIRAPFDGRIRRVNANIGQFISPGTPLGQIFSTDTVEIRLPFTGDDLGRIGLRIAYVAGGDDKGPKVVLSDTVAGQTVEWYGHIVRTDAAVDPSTRQISAIVSIDDPYGKGMSVEGVPLAVGLFVNAQVEGQLLDDVFVIPRQALLNNNGIYVLDKDNNIVRKQASVLTTISRGAVINGGIENGERVIVSRLVNSKEGDKVTSLPSELEKTLDPDAKVTKAPGKKVEPKKRGNGKGRGRGRGQAKADNDEKDKTENATLESDTSEAVDGEKLATAKASDEETKKEKPKRGAFSFLNRDKKDKDAEKVQEKSDQNIDSTASEATDEPSENASDDSE